MEVCTVLNKLNTLSCEELIQVDEVTSSLKIVTISVRDVTSRESLNSTHWSALLKLSSRASECLNSSSISTEELDFICELFRCLRNACAGSVMNQKHVISNQDILGNSAKIFTHFAKHHDENSTDKEISVLNCCLQFFGNIIYQNNEMQDFVWNTLYKTDVLWNILRSRNTKVLEYSLMVLYNCITPENADNIIRTKEGQEMLLVLTDSLCENLVDWGVFLLETFMKSEEFMQKCYGMLPMKNQLLILDLIAENVEETSGTKATVPVCSVNYIINLFIADAMDIVKICSSTVPDLKPVEISKMLSILCAASVHDCYSTTVKSSPKLLELALDVLKCVHLLGKSDYNVFSSLSNIQDISKVGKFTVEQSPSYCFKKNLIRLIGNVCCNCRDNQDQVRSMDGIPLLLDCCCLDARNPYIMQWCILAIRNLLEKNRENQEIVAKISVSGDHVNSPLLRELGLEVHIQDGKPSLRKYTNNDNS